MQTHPQQSITSFSLPAINMQSLSNLPSAATSLFTAYASFAATVMLFRSMINDVIPDTLKTHIISFLSKLFKLKSQQITIIIDEYNQNGRNQVYESAQIYLGTKISPTTEKFKVTKSHKQKALKITVEKDQPITDTFRDTIQLTWRFVVVREQERDFSSDKHFFELCFSAEHRGSVLDDYLPFVLEKAKEIRNHSVVKLFTTDSPINDDYGEGGGYGVWGAVSLDHPATFDTLAMEPEMKKGIMEDLDRFLRRRDYYKRVGKVWRRGYLLHGPPGTGKSSLIAAMANYLKFDVYDLELSNLESDSELKRTLLTTTNRSILVIEDIDCNAVTRDRKGASASSKSKLTLSGLLNFIDGLWSSCGDERIIVFTTNHKEKLDPALLRPGRMDMHIHMSYLTPNGFATLASNYLGIGRDYDLRQLDEIASLLESYEATAAEVAEELMRSEDADVALAGVLNLLKNKVAATAYQEGSVSTGPEAEVEEMEEPAGEDLLDSTGVVRRNMRKTRIGNRILLH